MKAKQLGESRPVCDVCDRPVDYMSVERHEHRATRRVTIACHGEKQTFEVEDELLYFHDRLELRRAFIRPPLLS